MDLFEEIVRETFLINESVSINGINDAINGMHPVWMTYDDEQGGSGKNRRLIYPVAYGLTTKGNPVIRAFQPQGSSKRGLTTPPNDREYPKWKYFRVDRIKNWRMISSRTFSDVGLDGFNENGDDSMSIVYTIAPIGGAKNLPKQKPDIGYKPITKQDVENIPTEPEQTPTPSTTSTKQSATQVVNNILNNIKNTGTNIEKKTPENLDNLKTNTDINTNNNNLTAPDTEPITKQEIGQTASPEEKGEKPVEKPVDEPVTKQDVNSETEEVKNNKLTDSFNDMMSRWNNLEK